jgi:hypothetical protein
MTEPTNRAPQQRTAWLLSAAALGSAGGWPWILFLIGPLPSVGFSFAAVLRARSLSNRRSTVGFQWRSVLGSAAVGLLLGAVCGFPLVWTWPDCPRLVGDRWTWNDILYGVSLAGIPGALIGAGLEVALQRGWAKFEPASATDPARARVRAAVWIAVGAIGWSVVNETMLPFIGLVAGRDPCNPEVGPVAVTLFAVAGALAGLRDARGKRASLVLACACVAGGALQTGRSAWNVTNAWPQRVEHGGHVACGCRKTSFDFGSMPILGIGPAEPATMTVAKLFATPVGGSVRP